MGEEGLKERVEGTPKPSKEASQEQDSGSDPSTSKSEGFSLQDVWEGLKGLAPSFPQWPLFLVLLACWIGIFHFIGNATLGYIKSPSLFRWLYNAYTARGGDDGHGLLIPFVVLALLWWKRHSLAEAVKRPAWSGVLVVAMAMGLHVLGYLIQIQRVSVVAFFLGVYGLVVAMWGWELGRRILFPYVLFAFSIPVSTLLQPITVPLRYLSTDIAAFVARVLLGIPVIQDGVQLYSPRGGYTYEVAAACSGIRSLMTLLALSLIFAGLYFRSWWRRVLVVGLAFPITVITNVLRLVVIMLAAETYGEKAGMFMHNWFGFVTFALALVILFQVERWLGEEKPDFGSRGSK